MDHPIVNPEGTPTPAGTFLSPLLVTRVFIDNVQFVRQCILGLMSPRGTATDNHTQSFHQEIRALRLILAGVGLAVGPAAP